MPSLKTLRPGRPEVADASKARPCASQKTGSVARGALPSAGQPHGSQSSSSFGCSRPELKGRSSLVCHVQATGSRQQTNLPENYVTYETMIVLRPTLLDDERDGELAKFEAFLKSEQAQDIQVNVRGRQQLAYPIKGHWDGIYVLYQYASKRVTSQNVQKYLSTPPIGGEISILRHMTFLT